MPLTCGRTGEPNVAVARAEPSGQFAKELTSPFAMISVQGETPGAASTLATLLTPANRDDSKRFVRSTQAMDLKSIRRARGDSLDTNSASHHGGQANCVEASGSGTPRISGHQANRACGAANCRHSVSVVANRLLPPSPRGLPQGKRTIADYIGLAHAASPSSIVNSGTEPHSLAQSKLTTRGTDDASSIQQRRQCARRDLPLWESRLLPPSPRRARQATLCRLIGTCADHKPQLN